MLKLMSLFFPAILLTVLWNVAPARAANEGQEDLDKAAEAKMTAETVSDLSEVIRLAESAMKKGLDEPNVEFAKKLLSSTFIQRGSAAAAAIFKGSPPPPNWAQFRQMALGDLEKAVKLDPKQPQAYLVIGQLNLLPEGDLKRAKDAIDKVIELGGDDATARAKALVMRASLQEKPEKKLADMDEAIRLTPGDAAMVRARGLLLADMDKLEPALVDLNKAIALAPEDGPTYEAKAIVLARLKKYDESLAALDKARQLNPDSVVPLLQRASVHSQQEKPDAALEDLNQALAMDPGNVVVLLLRAGVYQQKGEKDKALADADRAIHLKPDLPVAIRTRAMLLAENEQFDEATKELEKLRKLDPKDMLTLLQLAMLYGAQKQSGKAIETYNALLAEQPDEWRALRGRGDAYLNVGKHAEAIADYEKAIKLQPKDSGILNNFAWVLATSPDDKLRDGKRAIRLATDACEATEYKLPHVLSTLAAAYAETGDFDSAVKWSAKAVEIGDKEHDEALKKELENYKAKKPWRELLSEGKPVEK